MSCFVAFGCGGSTPPAEAPEPIGQTEPEPAPPPEPAPAPEPEPEPEAPAAAAPEFKDGMSVDEAIAVIPQGAERVNVDPETLGKPLAEMSVYEPCKPKPNQRVKIRVGVWDGRAVGVDVAVTPKNDKLAQCIKEQITKLEWRDKAKSLNTVEYAF